MAELVVMINDNIKMNKIITDHEKILLTVRDGQLVDIKREIAEKPIK